MRLCAFLKDQKHLHIRTQQNGHWRSSSRDWRFKTRQLQSNGSLRSQWRWYHRRPCGGGAYFARIIRIYKDCERSELSAGRMSVAGTAMCMMGCHVVMVQCLHVCLFSQALLINENKIGYCGGTILNEFFILSAAHCMNQSLSTQVVVGVCTSVTSHSSHSIHKILV